MQEASGGGYEVKIPLPEMPGTHGLLARYYWNPLLTAHYAIA